MTQRIAKFIADCGAASRRDAERMITDGRVTVNGVAITTPVCFIDPNTDIVAIDGKTLQARTKTRLYAFYKPIRTMTTTRDPDGRRTIYDVLPKQYRALKYIGRLDYMTTGLLLLTDDGDLARRMTLPSSKIERTYIANCGNVDDAVFNPARRGMTIDGIKYAPMKITRDGAQNFRVTISEGKKNEIRIVLAACGAPVRTLHRISFGPVMLGDMNVGEIRELPQKIIDEILKYFL